MPGEWLMCVWQAASVSDPSMEGLPNKKTIQQLTESFNKSDVINYNPQTFSEIFDQVCTHKPCLNR